MFGAAKGFFDKLRSKIEDIHVDFSCLINTEARDNFFRQSQLMVNQ
jgi:hypothetical protein